MLLLYVVSALSVTQSYIETEQITETLVAPTEHVSVPVEPATATAEVPVITETAVVTAVVTENPATATKEVTTPTAEIATTAPENAENFWTSQKAAIVYCGIGLVVIACVVIIVIRRRRADANNGQSDSAWRDPLLHAIDAEVIEK